MRFVDVYYYESIIEIFMRYWVLTSFLFYANVFFGLGIPFGDLFLKFHQVDHTMSLILWCEFQSMKGRQL